MTGARSFSRLVGFVALLVTAQAWFLSQKVSWLSPEDYRRYGHDLYQTRLWRFGYTEGHHGARLVRTVPDVRPAEKQGGGVATSDLGVGSEMRRDGVAPAKPDSLGAHVKPPELTR